METDMLRHLIIATLATALFTLSACSIILSEPVAYKGGASIDSNLSAEQYRYHYENGFKGDNVSPYHPNIHYAWSRTAAIQACGYQIDTEIVGFYLAETFGYTEELHHKEGFDFHKKMIRNDVRFCQPETVREAKAKTFTFERGIFPKVY